MNTRDEFWQELRAAHDVVAAEVDHVRDVKRRIPATPPARRPRRRWVASAAAAALVGATTVLIWVSLGGHTSSAAFDVGPNQSTGVVGAWIAAPEATPLPLAFSDGTRMTLRPRSRARVVQATENGAHLIVERGGLEAQVLHRDGAQWLVDVGPFHVQVVGTRFAVGWDPTDEVLELQLFQGAVQVSGAFLKDPLTVSEGQFLTADCRRQRSELGSGAPPARRLASAVAPSLGPSAAPVPGEPPVKASGAHSGLVDKSDEARPGKARDAGETWQALAATGRYREAFALLEQDGFASACASASAQERIQLGDVARLSGHPAEARQAYLDARRAGGGAMAAYGLGLTAFDQERSYAQAAKWFRTYLRERPGGGLRREALGRLMEALRRSGDGAGARDVARRYLQEFPNGTHASLARRLVRQ